MLIQQSDNGVNKIWIGRTGWSIATIEIGLQQYFITFFDDPVEVDLIEVVVVIAGRDEADIAELYPDDRPAFLAELGVQEPSIERLIRAAYRLLRLSDFFTAGEAGERGSAASSFRRTGRITPL